MKAKIIERNIVTKLRKRGWSYREIISKVKVAKSSVSYWCRDIKLNRTQQERLKKKRPLVNKGAETNRIKRKKEIQLIRHAAYKDIKKLTFNEFKLIGIALYWAEGSKTSSASITNSDPNLIQIMVRWFEKICNIPAKKLKAHLHLHSGQDEKKIKRYWSRITRIPIRRFGKSYIKPEGTGHRKNILYHGTIRIRYCNENLREKILSWIEKIHKEIELKFNSDR